jgi:hypothetical protein
MVKNRDIFVAAMDIGGTVRNGGEFMCWWIERKGLGIKGDALISLAGATKEVQPPCRINT